MKTPLPWQFEIQGQTRLNDAKLGNKINEIITYLTELTEMVEGKQDDLNLDGPVFRNGLVPPTPSLKEQLLGEINKTAESAFGVPIIAVEDVEAIINRLMP